MDCRIYADIIRPEKVRQSKQNSALKFAEESGEVIKAFNKGKDYELLDEASDVLYRLSILLSKKGFTLEQAMIHSSKKHKPKTKKKGK